MDLHRIEGAPEWAGVAAGERNGWQRLAARSQGIATPGNAITAIGLLLSLGGLGAFVAHHYWLGLAGLLVGRLLDIADGVVANTTGTKSPLGELLDVSSDKIITFLTLIALFVNHVAAWWVLIALLMPHVVITLITIYKSQRGLRLHPSQVGKLSMTLSWLSFMGLLLLRALQPHQGEVLPVVVSICILGAVVLGVVAMLGYASPAAAATPHAKKLNN